MAAAAVVLALAGCGGSTRAAVHVTVKQQGHTKTFTLGCDPVSGTLPLRAQVCADVARHGRAMLDPRPARSVCGGGPLEPVVRVDTADGTSYSGIPNCGWPGGTPLAIFWDASGGDRGALRRDSARLRCEDDPALLVHPTPWASVFACTHGLWTPAAERAIRRAETATPLAGLRPATLFPRDPGAVRCRVPAGGPVARSLPGLCEVRLTGPASSKLVHFAESWRANGHSFRHRWTIRGATVVAERGPVPPQLWR